MALLIQKDKQKRKKKESIAMTTLIKRPICIAPANKVCKTSKKVAFPVNDVQMETGEAKE